MGHESSLPHSKEPATCPYTEPDQSNPFPHPASWKSILIFYFPLGLVISSGLFPSGFPAKIRYAPLLSPIHAACLAHLIFLNLITRIIFGEEYRTLSSSLYSPPHSPVTSSLSGPNILLSTLFLNTVSLLSPSMWVTKFHPHRKQLEILYLSMF